MEEKKEVIELNAYEAAAYWWINRIRRISEEINNKKDVYDERKMKFGEIFDYSKIKTKGYRKLYLELARRFEERAKNSNRYSVSTHIKNKGHQELILWLSEIMETEVPDIHIAEYKGEEVVVTIIKEGKHMPPQALLGNGNMQDITRRIPTKVRVNPIVKGSSQINNGTKEKGE